ncbi:hypothetical protein SBV1_130074 [Verrucomicrobia bacterium]|nr:hypothetical protein SBV1_130074 [Verrucomicrobiota bacterium]
MLVQLKETKLQAQRQCLACKGCEPNRG